MLNVRRRDPNGTKMLTVGLLRSLVNVMLIVRQGVSNARLIKQHLLSVKLREVIVTRRLTNASQRSMLSVEQRRKHVDNDVKQRRLHLLREKREDLNVTKVLTIVSNGLKMIARENAVNVRLSVSVKQQSKSVKG